MVTCIFLTFSGCIESSFQFDMGLDARKADFRVSEKDIPKPRPPDKSAYWNIIFLISQPKHMFGFSKEPSQ